MGQVKAWKTGMLEEMKTVETQIERFRRRTRTVSGTGLNAIYALL